ncbi:hypothetical protein AAF712_002759 [Marasmius tenuissimus]|uniref:XRRM domain-containing protein n=1 Tax=Marasmius tenuissimus TaxID=585030 RepID=A0ABR3AA60_9AGAR|nr:hypothetical protein PM082_006057 [Marasmius tenuissimus]
MALNFVPRKVAKPKTTSISQTGSAHTSNVSQPHVNEDVKGKGKETSHMKTRDKPPYSDEDVCTVISLALADHAIWLNSEVRRKLVDSVNGGNEGFISFSYLLDHAPPLKNLRSSSISETAMVRSLRSRDTQLDVRMMFVKPEWHSWGKAKDQKDAGMYEIRRKDWQTLDTQLGKYSKDYWDNRTIYVENLPVQCKSVETISRFASALLASSYGQIAEPSSPSPFKSPVFSPTIQAVTLPPHHLAKDGDEPKCKGFAFVILTTTEDLEFLLEKWPWKRNTHDTSAASSDIKEAHRFGFRCLTRGRWEALKEEYLEYRRKLVKELVSFEEEQQETSGGKHEPVRQRDEYHQYQATVTDEQAHPLGSSLTSSSPFPPSCLVFVRNVHPETNKTTLKSLFARSFSTVPQPGTQLNGLDYVDYNKGMNTCYLRLSTPGHATALVDYFKCNNIVQGSGLDGCGSPLPLESAEDMHAIIMELVLGRREELYWEKVPTKVKHAAVQKCLKEMGIPPAGRIDNDMENISRIGGNGGCEGYGRKRRRE